jgi:hypothetical protein
MRRRSIAILSAFGCLMAGASVQAKDFRALDFGAPCDNLPAQERALGAGPYDETLPSGFQYAFRARDLDRDVVIGYACKDGRFFRGAYIFFVRDEAEATRVYDALKKRVTRERGAPSYDFASAEYRRKMRDVGATLSRADTQVAFWNNGHSEAHASVAEPSGQRGWRVSLSYSAE